MWAAYKKRVSDALDGLVATRGNGEIIYPEKAFKLWAEMAVSLPKDRTIHLIGNGASASMASHFAADITKNCGRRAMVFTDCALITALGNDHNFENCFAVALNRYALPGDLLVAVSSSGNSPNIIKGCLEAAKMAVKTVTVSGKKPDNALRALGEINFYVPAESYSLTESAHAVILHHWADRLEAAHKGH